MAQYNTDKDQGARNWKGEESEQSKERKAEKAYQESSAEEEVNRLRKTGGKYKKRNLKPVNR